jgi:hypothetical protein
MGRETGVSDALLNQRRQSVRIVTVFLVASSVAAFVPSRERELILSGSGSANPVETVLFTQPFPDPAAQAGVNYGGAPFGVRSGGSTRAFPRLGAFGGENSLPPATGTKGASDNGILPLGRTAEAANGGANPGFAPTSSDGSSAGGASSSGGVLPGSPGGGGGTIGTGSSGGGSSGGSSGGVPALVPEPDVWTMLILGFGLIGGLLRRNRRAMEGALPATETASALR